MSEIPHAAPEGDGVRSDVFADDCSRPSGKPSIFNSIWWSQTGSNRRPHACKARALPAELWPPTRRRMLYVGRGAASLVKNPIGEAPRERTRSKWWAWEDLNFRPHAYQARALTN